MDRPNGPSPLGGDEWYERFREYINDAMALYSLTREGAARIRSMPDVIDLLEQAVQPINDPNKLELDRQRRDALQQAAEQAVKAQATDFALLHAHSLMGLWGALEAAIEDLVCTRLMENPELLTGAVFSRLKLPVSALAMSDWDRARTIVYALQKDLATEASIGAGQFDKLLRAVDIDGGHSARVRRNFVLAQQYRHLVAHRGGRADQKFMKACPQVNVALGERVHLSSSDFNEIVIAIGIYTVTVMNRYRAANGQKLWATTESTGKFDSDWFVQDETTN